MRKRFQTGTVEAWKELTLDAGLEAWVFPSERNTPLSRDNAWRRSIQPKLEEIGLGWASFQVMRRTHSTLMNELRVDPKLVADQLGHSLDVNQNVYTMTGSCSKAGGCEHAGDGCLESLTRDFEGQPFSMACNLLI